MLNRFETVGNVCRKKNSDFLKKKQCAKFPTCWYHSYGKAIRIYHECEGRIEKSILMITVWHHEACRVMTNGNTEGQIFLSYPHTKNAYHCCFFYFKISFQKSLNTLGCNFT